MTTTDTQVPAWLNLDAFGFDPEDVHTIRQAVADIEPAVAAIRAAAERAQPAVERVSARVTITTAMKASDDVLEVISDYVGTGRLLGLLYEVADIVVLYELQHHELLDDATRERLESITREHLESITSRITTDQAATRSRGEMQTIAGLLNGEVEA